MKNKFNSNKIFLALFMVVFTLSLISSMGCADTGWKGFAKLNENKTVCVNCPTCAFINISVTSPDNTNLFMGESMTKTDKGFCYTFNSTQNDQLGTYQIYGNSNLNEPLGLCFDTTFSGKENNIWAYIFGLTFTIFLLLGVVWLNRKFDYSKREQLYKSLVLGFVEAKEKNNKSDFATMILYLIGYGILNMMFVLYYLVVIIFLLIFKDYVISFGINAFTSLAPELVKISLYGLTLVGFYFMAKIYEVIKLAINDITDQLRGVWEQ